MTLQYTNIKKIIYGFFILLCVLFVYKTFNIFNAETINDSNKSHKKNNPPSQESMNLESKQIESYLAIIDRNIFDSQNRPTEAPTTVDEMVYKEPELPPLNATLLGCIANQKKEKSIAMININGKTKSYKIGDMLDGNSKIISIDRQSIEVDRNGKIEELRKESGSSRGSFSRLGGNSIISGGASDEISESGSTVSKDSIANVFKDGDIFGQIMSLMPNTEGEGVRGFKIMQVSPGDIYSVLGLKNGDILLNANGQVLDNIDLLITFLQDLPQKKSFDIVVQRGGKSQKLAYKVK